MLLAAVEIGLTMEPYLAERDQSRSGAESSLKVDRDRWNRYLGQFNVPIELEVGPDDFISRSDLFHLAEHDRMDTTPESIMRLFWHVMAWGLAGSWRNVPRLTQEVLANEDRVVAALREAQQMSFAGDVASGFDRLQFSIKHWGSAFFTKFLHFTADHDEAAKTQALILDDRVRLAWRIFTGVWLNEKSSRAYEQYCRTAGEIARARGSAPGWLEGCLYQFGRRVGTHERWLTTELELCRAQLGENAPSVEQVWTALA